MAVVGRGFSQATATQNYYLDDKVQHMNQITVFAVLSGVVKNAGLKPQPTSKAMIVKSFILYELTFTQPK